MALFTGKTVFITGASSGIGAALAVEFVREGARVAAAARRKDRLDALCAQIAVEGGEAIALACDVCDRTSIDAAVAQTVDRFGGIDIVVANAGFGVSGFLPNLSSDDFRRQFETNFFGVVDTLYAALPHLERTQGCFAVVSSVMGRVGLPASGPYNASKFALCGLCESIYYDLTERGVAVVCIDPGLVESEFRSVKNDGTATDSPDPAPRWLVMPRAKAARQIVRGIHRRTPEFVVTGHGKLICFVSRHFPRTLRYALRAFTKGRIARVEAAKRGPGAR